MSLSTPKWRGRATARVMAPRCRAARKARDPEGGTGCVGGSRALRDWSQRLRLPMALEDASGQRIVASEAYLRREQPYDCAGSAKAEGLGIALIARIETDDPTSLIGLPLIALSEMLEQAGLPVI